MSVLLTFEIHHRKYTFPTQQLWFYWSYWTSISKTLDQFLFKHFFTKFYAHIPSAVFGPLYFSPAHFQVNVILNYILINEFIIISYY